MKPWKPKRILVILVLLTCFLFPLFAGAEQSLGENQTTSPDRKSAEGWGSPVLVPDHPGLSMAASIGYDGIITYLRKLPVRVSLQNDGADFTGVLAMNVYRYEQQYDRYEMPISVAAGAVVEVEMSVELSMRQSQYELELLADGGRLVSYSITPRRVLDPTTLLIGTLGGTPLSQFQIASVKDPLKRGEMWQTIPLTEETFPRDEKTLQTFGMLAIDGFDARGLDVDQQRALDLWLQNGGIVIVGGGAQASAGYPYFEKYTGILAGSPYKAADATPALLAYLKSAEKPFGEDMMLVEMKGAKNAVAKADVPLIDVVAVDGGFVITTAFSLSDKPLISWQGNIALWQRILLMTISDKYHQLVEFQKNYYNRANNYIYQSILNGIEIPTDSSFLLPLLLLLVFVLVVGIGSYWVLKKRDKREWMWLTIPGLSILFAVGLLLASQGLSLNEPVFVVSDYVFQNAEGLVTEQASVSAAMDKSLPMTITVDNGSIVPLDNSNYYEEWRSSKEIGQLRYTYWQGEPKSITLPAVAPWSQNSILVDGETPPEIKVNGSCWFEEDGLHIRLINEGENTVAEGKVITSYGYVSARELLPGQSADYLLKNPAEKATGKPATTNGNGNYPIYDGVMFGKEQQRNADMYSVFSAIVYPEIWTDSAVTFYLTEKHYAERSMINSIYDQMYSKWQNTFGNVFHYVSFNDSMCRMAFALNGQTVRRTAQANILDIELKYLPISPKGFVKYGNGSIPVYWAEVDGSGEWMRSTLLKERYRYFRLVDKPVFCFVLPKEAWGMEVTDAQIVPQYSAGDYKMALYNNKTHQWDELNLKTDLKKQLDLSTHLNAEGELYVQFTPGVTSDSYSDINVPFMSVEGRVE